jgi:hypothetical protein
MPHKALSRAPGDSLEAQPEPETVSVRRLRSPSVIIPLFDHILEIHKLGEIARFVKQENPIYKALSLGKTDVNALVKSPKNTLAPHRNL